MSNNNDPRSPPAPGSDPRSPPSVMARPGTANGIGQSTPLVTIPQSPVPPVLPQGGGVVPLSAIAPPAVATPAKVVAGRSPGRSSGGPTTTSVSGSDHPLAAAPTAPSHHQEPSLPASAGGATRQAPQQPPPNPTDSTTAGPTMTPMSLSLLPAPPPIGPTSVAVPKVLASPPTLSHQNQHMNADEMADAFLSGVTTSDSEHMPMLRPLPLPETQTELERTRILVERRAWGDVLSMTASLLKSASSHYAAIYGVFLNKAGGKSKVPASLLNSQQIQEFTEILILQGHAWIQMRRYKELGTEVQEWSHCHYNTTNNRSEDREEAASWIPWYIYIFAAASLHYTSKDRAASTTALWQIRHDMEKEMPATVQEMIHLDHTLSNIFTVQGEWRMCLESLDRLVKLLPRGAAKLLGKDDVNDSAVQVLTNACRCEVFSRQGRVLLQMGAIEGAQTLLDRAASCWQGISSQTEHLAILKKQPEARRILQQIEPQIQANFGLLQFAYQKYNLALEHFRKTLQIMETSEASLSKDEKGLYSKYLATDWVGGGLIAPVTRHSLFSEVTSNLAVTALYTVRFLLGLLLAS